ncbi:MAG: acetate/propionate family kinase [Streptosporangiales bacterium]|nr:acetate/propionate family kinase [Streptosporangiales bacterium]
MTPYVLVINSGSSSLKYRLLDMEARTPVARGSVERIGEREGGHLTHHGPDGTDDRDADVPDHEAGLRAALDAFGTYGPDLNAAGLAAIGHRVVHGGDRFRDPVLLDDEVERVIDELAVLAPLHNPANLEGIRVARRLFPEAPHVAVFDTAFHQTLPEPAYTYAVPERWRTELGVRRYGFHGTSHAYVSRVAAETLRLPLAETDLIVLHLGNGASAAAIHGGRSVDTSMGLTPLEGLVMGTRSGDLDPEVTMYLERVVGMGSAEVDRGLNRESGLLGLCGDNDMREVVRRAERGEESAALALDVYCHRIRKYVGAYLAVLGRLDALIFTAGVGEHSVAVRARALSGLEGLGLRLDEDRNREAVYGDEPRVISPDDAPIAVLVVPTDEELQIADEALGLVG